MLPDKTAPDSPMMQSGALHGGLGIECGSFLRGGQTAGSPLTCALALALFQQASARFAN